jgi:hypothetical protein
MGYSKYKKIKNVVKKFNLELQTVELFGEVTQVAPSEWLQETLKRAEITLLTSEKAKSERIISPILVEVFQAFKPRVAFFSGEQLNVNPKEDLAGECDFFFALHPPKPYVDAPIISLAEAKNEDMNWGIAQCAAQMLGAKFYNEAEKKNIPFIYGCATDGIEWQFLKLEDNTYSLDNRIFTHLPEILGVWHYIINLYL